MVKNLVSRSEFARLAGVSAAAVTKACNSILKAAVSGKRIDASHPDAVAYLEEKAKAQTPPPAHGIDPLYDEAVQFCTTSGRFAPSAIQRGLKIGYNRAKRIFETMTAAGLVPDKDTGAPAAITVDLDAGSVVDPNGRPALKAHVRGTAAARETKKRDALEQANQEPTGVVHDIPEDIRKFADYTLRDLIAQFGTDVAFLDWLKATKAIEDIHEKRLKNAEKAGELISRAVVSDGLISTIDGAFTRMLTDGAKTIAVRTHSLVTTGADVGDIEDLVSKQLTTFIRPTKSKLYRVLKNV